jgi:hypothetical protein
MWARQLIVANETKQLGIATAWFRVKAARHLPRRTRLMGADVFFKPLIPQGEALREICNCCGGFHNERICIWKRKCLECSSTGNETDENRASCGGIKGRDGL